MCSLTQGFEPKGELCAQYQLIFTHSTALWAEEKGENASFVVPPVIVKE